MVTPRHAVHKIGNFSWHAHSVSIPGKRRTHPKPNAQNQTPMNCETPLTSHRKSLRIRRCLALLLLAINTPPAFVFAQDTPAPPKPPINFQVLGTTTINLGNRSAIYNLVVPPPLPAAPDPAPTAPPLTADQIKALEQQQPPPKKSVVLFLSATVFDYQVTQLRWWDENGTHSAYSNVDFNYFSGAFAVETADTSYFLIMGLGNDTREAATANRVQVPPLSQFDKTHSQYVVAKDGSKPSTTESLKCLADLHSYFDSNKQRMIEGYNKRVTDQAAQAQWLLAHPPAPKDTIINIWPITGANQPTATQGGRP